MNELIYFCILNFSGMTIQEVREIEQKFQSRTNEMVNSGIEHSDSQHSGISNNVDVDRDEDDDNDTFEDALEDLDEMSGASGTSR